MSRSRVVLAFLALAYGLSWMVALLFQLTGGDFGTPAAQMTAIVYAIMPGVAAVLVQYALVREDVPGALGISLAPNRWFLAAWGLPFAIAFATLAVNGLVPGVSLSFQPIAYVERFASQLTAEQLEQARKAYADTSPVLFFVTHFVFAAMMGVTVHAFVSLGEELGWRGLLLKQVAHLGFWRASLATGFASAVWAAPLSIIAAMYPGRPAAGAGLAALFALLAAPLVTYVRLRARSVLAAAIFRGGLRAGAAFTLLFVAGGDDLTRGLLGAPGLAVLALGNVWLLVKGPGEAEQALAELARLRVPASVA